jgi:acetylornithine deacetylase
LVFEVHQDTVPAEGMTIDPWDPLLQDDRLYGRGACDDKGPMACMLTAFARLARERPRKRATVILACTVNEEHGFTGAEALSQAWSRGDDPLVPRLPDAMVVAEPTSLDIVVAHKGVVRWRCHSSGRAVHSSRPDQGRNAIYAMGSVIGEVERYSHALADTRPHPLLGVPTVNLGTIQGGVCVNMVPDACTIELDRRLLPDEAPAAAQQAMIAWLERRLPPEVWRDLRHDVPSLAAHGLAEEGSTAWAERVQRVLGAVDITPRRIGVPYATDAPFFAQLGIPTIILGPGSIEQAHTADEWVPVSELHVATEAYYRLALET